MYQKLLALTMQDMPIKKRRFRDHSVSPPSQTGSRTPKEAKSFESDKVVEGAFPASQKSHSEFGEIHGPIAVISPDGLSNARNARTEQAPDAVVTKGKTLASIEPDSLVEKESEDSKSLPVQVDSFTPLNDFHSDKNDQVLGKSSPSKINRLHWDLNIMMDEWEKPNAENDNQQMNNTEFVANDGVQNVKATSDPVSIQEIEAPSVVLHETKGPDSERNEKATSDPVSIQKIETPSLVLHETKGPDSERNGKATSDAVSIQKIETPSFVLHETKGPDSERTVLQVSSGLVNTEKTNAASKAQDPTMVINMNDLDNNLHSSHTTCTFTEQKNNTADIPVQCDKDMSRTPATGLCKLSSKSDTTKKADSISFGMPVKGKPKRYGNRMKDDGSADVKINSGKDPKLASEDVSSGCNNSNVTGNNSGHVVSVECMSNLQAGYDSPMEDGELRDPDAYNWKKNEVDFSKTGQLENELVGRKYSDTFEHNYKNDNQLSDYRDDANAKGQDGELDDNGSQTRGFRPRKYKKKLSAHDEGAYNGPVHRKNFASTQHQRRNENNGCEVDFPLTNQESRSFSPHRYRNSEDPYRSRLRRVNSGPPARASEMSSYDKRQFPDEFSDEIYRPSTRRRFPDDRDDSNENYRGAPFRRGKNKRKRNKKSGFHSRGTRAPKEEHNERSPEKFSSRRDLKSSANFDQAAHTNRLYRKPQSESSLFSAAHVLNEQDRGPSDRVSRHSQWQNNQVEFPRRLKPDGNFRSLPMRGVKSPVVANDRKCSFENSDTNRSIHDGKIKSLNNIS